MNALIIFVRKPELGKVKTRLAAQVGNDNALEIYKSLLTLTQKVCKRIIAHKYLFGTDSADDIYWKGFFQAKQMGNNLGSRMMNAFNYLFKKDYKKVIIIGSDCPALCPEIIEDAYKKLDNSDIVLGPAEDGGYYLLGMKNLEPAIFSNIEWSSEKVLSETINIINSLSLSHSLLPMLSDIDTEEDWIKYQR